MIADFTPKTDRQRRAWVRWCEAEYEDAKAGFLDRRASSRAISRFYDAAERLHDARDADACLSPDRPPTGA